MKKTMTIAAVGVLTASASANSLLLGGSDDSLAHISATAATPAPAEPFHVSDDLPPMLGKGTQEFGVQGNVNFADDIAYNLTLSYGWFVKNNWEIGLVTNVQGLDSDVNFGLGLFTEYNFYNGNPCKFVPYVGFSMSWAHLDSDAFSADSISLGLDLGIKYFIRENVAVSFSIGAKYAFDDVFPGGDDFAQQIDIGTRFYF